MAFDAQGLISYGTGGSIADETPRNKLWHYVTNDTLAAVAANAYFDSVSEQMTTGDIIQVSADLDGTIACQTYVATVTTGDVALTASA